MNHDLRMTSNQRLGELCQAQTALFKRNKQKSDDSFCFELLRRAIYRIHDAADVVFDIYYDWLRRKIVGMFQRQDDAVDDLAQDAMMRFFVYVTPKNWGKFQNLAHVLAYMGKCGQAVVYNYWKQSRTVHEHTQVLAEHHEETVGSSQGETERPLETRFERTQELAQLWQCVKMNCLDTLDLFLAQQLWQYGLRPKEIATKYPDRFPKPVEVYKRKRNLVDRIKRDESYKLLTYSFAA